MNEMALETGLEFEPYGLRLSMLPLDHGGSPQYWNFASERERNILFFLNLNAGAGNKPLSSDFSKQAALTTASEPPLRPVPRWLSLILQTSDSDV